MLAPVSHGEYADGIDRQSDGQMDGRQTVTLLVPTDAASVKNPVKTVTFWIQPPVSTASSLPLDPRL